MNEIVSIGPGEDLTNEDRSVLLALVQHGPCTQEQVALIVGYPKLSTVLNTTLAKLRFMRLAIVNTSSEFASTPAGVAQFPPGTAQLPTGLDLAYWWCDNRLGVPAQRRTLLAIADAGAAGISRTALAEATGYDTSSSTLRQALAVLRTLGLIEANAACAYAAPALLTQSGDAESPPVTPSGGVDHPNAHTQSVADS